MKKEEAKKLLDDTKVYVSNKSELVQKKLFEIGYTWSNKTKVIYTYTPYLYIHKGIIDYGRKPDDFLKDSKRLVSVDDILDIEIDKESKEFDFKLYDEVLVRNLDGDVWIPALFFKIVKRDYFLKDRYEMIGIDDVYEQCIPYNDKTKHLLGTTDKYQD